MATGIWILSYMLQAAPGALTALFPTALIFVLTISERCFRGGQ